MPSYLHQKDWRFFRLFAGDNTAKINNLHRNIHSVRTQFDGEPQEQGEGVPATFVRVAITKDPVVLERLLAFISDGSRGATASFLGIVRNHNDGRRVTAVSYDVFEPLAENILKEIAEEACGRWNVKIAAVHRLGRLKVGEISVAVTVGAPHRAEAFAACRYVIEGVKERLPIWKKEHYVDGRADWLSGHALQVESIPKIPHLPLWGGLR